jgi:hypothetical protein
LRLTRRAKPLPTMVEEREVEIEGWNKDILMIAGMGWWEPTESATYGDGGRLVLNELARNC